MALVSGMKEIKTRIERGILGELEVPVDRYWGIQTQRSLNNFKIGLDLPGSSRMPMEIIRALALVKIAAAKANGELQVLNQEIAQAIEQAAQEVIDHKFDDQFPLVVWQTGSGTQTNMNVNEVIANRAIEIMGGEIGSKTPVHPNDHVNLSQSSNDCLPSAMHIAIFTLTTNKLIPSIKKLIQIIDEKEKEFSEIIKIGRTHMQDAVPITLGQEFSGYNAQIKKSLDDIEYGLSSVSDLAQGATAVGTGLNAPKGFAALFIKHLNQQTGLQFCTAANKFAAISSYSELLNLSGTLNNLAVALNKICNDIRLMASGPRCGIGELKLPLNEPGSSIMPGKINPTQIEAMLMICLKVIGNHQIVTMACANGILELNMYKPLIADSLISSIHLLSDGIDSLIERCLTHIKPNLTRIAELTNNSLMLATALSPHIGYDKASRIAKFAYENDITLKEAAIDLKLITAEEFDEIVDIKKML